MCNCSCAGCTHAELSQDAHMAILCVEKVCDLPADSLGSGRTRCSICHYRVQDEKREASLPRPNKRKVHPCKRDGVMSRQWWAASGGCFDENQRQRPQRKQEEKMRSLSVGLGGRS